MHSFPLSRMDAPPSCEQSRVAASPKFHFQPEVALPYPVTSTHIVRVRHFIARRARATLRAKLDKRVRTTRASRERAHRARQRRVVGVRFHFRGAWRGLPKIAPPLGTRRGKDDGERGHREVNDGAKVDDLRTQKVGRWVSSRWLERQGFVASRAL